MTSWIRKAVARGKRVLNWIPRTPTQVQLEITNRCNFDCVMCQRKDLGVVFRDMPFDLYRTIIDRLPEAVRLVALTGWGEPTMHPDLVEMIRYARDRGKRVTVTTNGVLLRGDLAERILDSGITAMTFSIDSLEEEDQTLVHWEPAAVIRNVLDFVGKIRDRQLKIGTGVNATLHAGRAEEVYKIIRFAAEHHIDQVSVLRLDLRYQKKLQRYTWQEEQEIFRAAHRLGRELSVGVQTVQSYHGRGGRFLSLLNRRCPKPFDYVYINWKGGITPCCSLPTLSLHNILEENLQEIWRGPRFSHFRRNQRKICGTCDVLYYRYHPALAGNGQPKKVIGLPMLKPPDDADEPEEAVGR